VTDVQTAQYDQEGAMLVVKLSVQIQNVFGEFRWGQKK
jgi:hypothetical protein